MNTRRTVTIYKATQKGKGQRLVEQGFHPNDFPSHPPNADGKCYFAAPNSRSLAEEYHRYYKDGILEVTIDSEIYARYFKPHERPYQGAMLYPQVLKPLHGIYLGDKSFMARTGELELLS